MRVAQQAIAEATSNGATVSARAINNYVSQLQRQADQAGKTRAELLGMKAAQMGISDSVSSYINKISEASKHMHEFSVGSAGARREMLVLAHEASQGSWSKFGGSLLVLGERTDALSLLFSGAGVTAGAFAAAAAGVAVAAIKGAEDLKQFNAALALTNNYAGVTAQSFNSMAERVSFLAGSGLGKASEVLRDLAASGEYTASEMEGLATTILRTSQISGKSLEDVSKQYAKLAEDPAKWAYEHNQSMHFMDVATYQHIEALQQAGDKHKAIQAVIDATAAQVQASTETHLSGAAQAWRNLTHEVDTFWSKLKQGLTSGPSIQDRIETLLGERNDISGDKYAAGRVAEIDRQVAALKSLQRNQADNASYQASIAQTQQAAVEAEKRREAMRDQMATNAEKREKELAQLNRDRQSILAGGGSFPDSDYQRMVSDIQARYKDPKPHSNAEAYHGQLAQMTAANQVIEAEERRHETQLKAQRNLGLIDGEAYITQLADIQTRALDQEIANAQKRVDIARAKPESAAYQEALKDLQKYQDQRSSIMQSRDDSLQQLQQQRARDVQRFGMQAYAPVQQQGAAYAAADAVRFATVQQAAEYSAKLQMAQQFGQKMQTLYEQYGLDPASDQKAYMAKVQYQAAAYQQEAEQLQQHLAQEQQIRDSYTDQMHLAVTKIAGDSQTNAQAAASAFTTAWQDSANALDQYLTTGQGNFKTFTASILADMAKIALHQAELQAFQAIGTSFFSTGGPVGHFADGGAISGPGTSTSDSIPAMLSSGEYVINAASTRKYRSLLDSINHGRMAHFATGGPVSGGSSSGGSSGGTPVSVVVHNNGGGGLTDQDAKDMHALVQAFVDKRMDQRIRGQGGYAYQIRHGQI